MVNPPVAFVIDADTNPPTWRPRPRHPAPPPPATRLAVAADDGSVHSRQWNRLHAEIDVRSLLAGRDDDGHGVNQARASRKVDRSVSRRRTGWSRRNRRTPLERGIHVGGTQRG